MKTWLVALAALFVGAVLFASPALAQKKDKDSVQLKAGGKAEVGKITAEDFAGVSLEIKAGQTKVIPWADVGSIDYSNAGALDEALEALNSGRLDEALASFEKVKTEAGKTRPVLQQHALYNTALILQRQGKFDAAAAAYKELFAAFPRGRYLRMAGENWISTLLAKGDNNAAEAAVATINLAAQGATGIEGDLAMLKARVSESKKSWADARTSYEAAEKAAPAGSDVAQEAKLGRARALVGEGKRADAETLLNDIKKTGTSNTVLAGAWNTLAELLTEDGRSKRNTEILVDALLMHLRGVVQYLPLPGASTREYERALAGASLVCKYISELETNGDRKRIYKQRSDEHLARLKKEFPNSSFLKAP
ncbi:MAG: tetratricopeptide repeat protein [Planctomycetes bacterium]|nr:tetratricopeptide repeat protein [Planctomycetota bacterium]